MSHYSVAVISRRPYDIDMLLAPYDENKIVPHYITKAELIQSARESFERTRDTAYAEYLQDPVGFAETVDVHYLDFIKNKFPKRFDWTDEDFYQYAIRDWHKEDIQPDGSVYTEYNPDSKWDWWYVRGNWVDGFPEYGDKIKNIDPKVLESFTSYAVITPDGEWHAPGEMGWFACSTETDEEWNDWAAHYKERFIDTADPNMYLTLVDCHI